MDTQKLLHDLQACVDDGEWERADAYLEDLRASEVTHKVTAPRVAGAVAQTLSGIEHAIATHSPVAASFGLRHLGYLLA
jgi:hypothetical protein